MQANHAIQYAADTVEGNSIPPNVRQEILHAFAGAGCQDRCRGLI